MKSFGYTTWWQRFTHKIQATLTDPVERKKWLKRQAAKILANIARNAHKNEDEPWND